jgi:tetratricopeptide (TPR) repeat protein
VSRALLALCGLLAVACATPLEIGERHYREGDRIAALDVWRSVPEGSRDHERARRRIAEVESEFERLVLRYKQRGRYYEERGRLAESILSYRLALELQPGDAATLEHVQRLARVLAARKRELRAAQQQALAGGDLAAARDLGEQLRTLDPIDPELEAPHRQLAAALRQEIERLERAGRRDVGSGDWSSAERSFRAALALDPEDESARGYLAYLANLRRGGAFATEAQIRAEGFHQNALTAEARGNLYRASRLEVRALEADEGHADARRHLAALRERLAPDLERQLDAGRSAFREEDLHSALDHWRKALLIDPRNERAQAYVNRAERQLQNLERLRSEAPEPGSEEP